ncbi:hypothetical protein O9993_09600 [Vibrio lentus]|nr:hypothetical protein [Vibrio lentus]
MDWIFFMKDGWHVTSTGLKAGGGGKEDKATQNLFVVWHDSLVRNNKRLKQSVVEFPSMMLKPLYRCLSFLAFVRNLRRNTRQQIDIMCVQRRAIIDNARLSLAV